MSEFAAPAESNAAPIPCGEAPTPRSNQAAQRVANLSESERRVLLVLRDGAWMTSGQLRARTGLTCDELAQAVQSLRLKGHLRRLNTVVESYASSLPNDRPGV
jgi:hypothetical protein